MTHLTRCCAIQMDFTEEVYSLAALQMKFESFIPGHDGG